MAHAVSHAENATVTIRDVRGADELRACQDLQRRAWGITEDGYVLPVATMAGAQKVGGLILGAFDAQDHLVGFAFAFLGRLKDRLILYSQLTGVHPAHQSTGIGRLLKFEQRRRARDMALDAVVWAFDPLQASNAAFNLPPLRSSPLPKRKYAPSLRPCTECTIRYRSFSCAPGGSRKSAGRPRVE